MSSPVTLPDGRTFPSIDDVPPEELGIGSPLASQPYGAGLENKYAPTAVPARQELQTAAPVQEGGNIAPVTEMANSDADGMSAENDAAQYLTQVPNLVPQGQGPTVVPETSDYLKYGGPQGKENVEKAFFGIPGQIRDAVQTEADLKGQEAAQVGDVLTKEQARQQNQNDIINQNYKNDIANQQAQQDFIQKKTQDYTNDLADTGKFWRNPANVLSSMFTSLLAFTGDPTVGVRIINQQIQNDLQQRRHLADMDLGALRSNLAGYRQIAGDKYRGDLLAESEAKRVAAMELQRIAQRFEGPKAKAAADVISKKLEQESLVGFMKVYSEGVYSPAHAENPAIAAAYAKTGKANPGVGRGDFNGTAGGVGVPSVGGGNVLPGKSGIGPVPQGGPKAGVGASSPAVEAAVKYFAPQFKLTDEQKSNIDSRSPGMSGRLEQARLNILRQVIMQSGGLDNPKLTKVALTEKMAKYEEDARKEIKDLSAANVKTVADRTGMQRIQRDAGQIEAVANRLGTTPDNMMGWFQAVGGGSLDARIDNYYGRLIADGDPKKRTMWENEKTKDREAIQRFKQLLQGRILETYHEFAGGNQTKGEKEGLEAYVKPGSSWHNIRGYIDDRSRTLGADYRNAAAGTSNPMTRILWEMRMGNDAPALNSQGIQSKKKE